MLWIRLLSDGSGKESGKLPSSVLTLFSLSSLSSSDFLRQTRNPLPRGKSQSHRRVHGLGKSCLVVGYPVVPKKFVSLSLFFRRLRLTILLPSLLLPLVNRSHRTASKSNDLNAFIHRNGRDHEPDQPLRASRESRRDGRSEEVDRGERSRSGRAGEGSQPRSDGVDRVQGDYAAVGS